MKWVVTGSLKNRQERVLLLEMGFVEAPTFIDPNEQRLGTTKRKNYGLY